MTKEANKSGYEVRLIDDISEAGVTYIGKSIIGEPTDSPKWIVWKVEDTGIGYATGSYDDRLTLTYL